MDSESTGDDALQPEQSSDDGKASNLPSMSLHVGQLFTSLTSAAHPCPLLSQHHMQLLRAQIQ